MNTSSQSTKFNDIQSELESFEKDSSERAQFDQRYFALKSHCQSLLQNSQFNSHKTSSHSTDGFYGKWESLIPRDVSKLPESKLPIFNGEQSTIQNIPPPSNQANVFNLSNIEPRANKSNPLKSKCLYCARNHPIFTCRQFFSLCTSDRNKHVNI